MCLRNVAVPNPHLGQAAEALSKLPDETVIDGDRRFREAERPSFDLLQNSGRGDATLILYAFDLLTLKGEDIMHRPLEQHGELAAIRFQGLEGVIAKGRDSITDSAVVPAPG